MCPTGGTTPARSPADHVYGPNKTVIARLLVANHHSCRKERNTVATENHRELYHRFFPSYNSPQPVLRYQRSIPTPCQWRLRNLGNRYAPFTVGECKSPNPKSRLREGAQKSPPHHRFGSSRAVTLHNRSRSTIGRFQHHSDGKVQVAPFFCSTLNNVRKKQNPTKLRSTAGR